MFNEEKIREMVKTAEVKGVVLTLASELGGSVRVRIPIGARACETAIEDIDMSVRSFNALKRAGAGTVGDVVELIEGEGLLRIRNLGVKSRNEIKTRILVFAYERLTQAEKHQFFRDAAGNK